MTGDRAINDGFTEAVELRGAPRQDGAPSPASAGPEEAQDRARALRLVLLTQISKGDDAGAADTAARLSDLPGQPEALDLLVDAALETGAVQVARSAVSNAEGSGTLPPWRAAHLKARIAIETGDLLAARAILVMAIDAAPDNAALRALLAEAMVAAGTASDARAVLGHVGKSPVNPRPPALSAARGSDGQTGASMRRCAPDSTQG